MLTLQIGRVAVAAIAMLALSPASAATSCDENCLLGVATTYLDSLTANDPTGVQFSRTLRSTENGVPTAPGAGIWKTATAWGYRHTFVDATTGQIGVFGSVVEADDKRAIVTVRLKVTDRQVAESELLVAHEGDFSLFNVQRTDANPVFGAFVAPEYRSSRAALAAVAKSYFEGITHADPSLVQFHPDCNRVENGVQTTNSPPRMTTSCAEGLHRFAYMQHYRELRIPVIDTARGLVWAVTAFDMPLMQKSMTIRGKPYEITPERQHLPRTMFLYELFKVEGGKIRAIEA